MKRYIGILTVMAFLIVAFVIGITPNADANFILDIGGTLVTDNGVGDINPAVGVITFSGAVGAFSVNVTTGLSKPIVGPGVIDLNSVDVTTSGPGVLTIWLSDTDFTMLGQENGLGYMDSIGGTLQNKVQATGYLDPSNAVNGTTYSTPTQTFTNPPKAFSGIAYLNVPAGVLSAGQHYSLSKKVVITHTGNGTTSFDNEMSPVVPEPGTLLLLGAGLVGLIGYSKLRLQRRK